MRERRGRGGRRSVSVTKFGYLIRKKEKKKKRE